MSIPAQMKAIKCTGKDEAALATDVQLPKLDDTYILVRVAAVALNPTDWKHIGMATDGYNHTVGCDYAGTVVQVGSKVTKSFKPGDRVAGFAHGMKHEDKESGAFAEYVKAKGDVQLHIPHSMSFEEASTLGVGVTTVGQSMFQSMGMPWPNDPSKEHTPILVYGASTATGLFAVQFGKLAGLRVIATCSPRNFDKVKSLGASEVVDYKDADACVKKIQELTDGKLKYAMDCISLEGSVKICAAALGEGSGIKYRSLLPVDFPRKDVDSAFTVGYNVNGEPYTFFGNKIEPTQDDFEFGKKWWALAEELLAQGKLKPIEPTLSKGGFQGIFAGLDDLKNDRVSGQKLVYRIAD